ncbi:hypothetical protein PR048_015618 [Dryococelus australis]|uniref:Pol protein n=1 Tax=Dryococelus australis TaxID=614101 RepID=A0ABQ9HHQ7_9NEOP|nr:hypothetical protein PR048_015618 [Dryococelus australis]
MKKNISLGHVISEDRICPDKDKVAVFMEYPASKTFIGLFGYYLRFFPSFSKIAQPLTELTKKDVAFEWYEIRENAFAELCEALWINLF